MKSTSTFQIALLAVFSFFIIGAILIFAVVRNTSSNQLPAITMWGTLPQEAFNQVLGVINQNASVRLSITYVEKREQDFDRDLTEALASGTGPNAILFPHTSLLRQKSRIYSIPYASYPLRSYKDNFIDEAELFLFGDGITALPIAVDPLVMYWNKDIFATAGLSLPPKNWDEFYTLVPKITQRDKAGNISQSTVSLGEYSNITNAKELLSALFVQAGTPIVGIDSSGRLVSKLSDQLGYTEVPAETALRFFTEFSNPAKTTYTWNRSLKSSQDLFTANDLAVYFGFASENSRLERRNPNLNYDVASLPQPRSVTKKFNYGQLYGVAVMKASPNVAGTLQVISQLVSADFASRFATASGLTPVRRDLLSQLPNDPVATVAYQSALISRAWLDPDPIATRKMFKTMIESVTSGQSRPSEAVREASQELQSLLQ